MLYPVTRWAMHFVFIHSRQHKEVNISHLGLEYKPHWKSFGSAWGQTWSSPYVSLKPHLFHSFTALVLFYQAPCTGLHSFRRKHQLFSCHGLCICISSDNSTLRLLHIWLLFILVSILCFWSPGCPIKGTSPPPFIHYHIAQLIFFTALSMISWQETMFTPLGRQYWLVSRLYTLQLDNLGWILLCCLWLCDSSQAPFSKPEFSQI